MIEVVDAGIGIAAENLERMFRPFEQADPTTTRRYGGTGLGLSIARRLIERRGGSLTATSQLGVGGTFRAEFVAPRVAASSAHVTVAGGGDARTRSLRILGPVTDARPLGPRGRARRGRQAGARGPRP